MSYDDELGKILKVADDLVNVLNDLKAAPLTRGDPEIDKLLQLVQSWIYILVDNPDKEDIGDVFYDVQAEIQYYGWGGNIDLGELTDRLNDLQDEFYEAIIYAIDALKVDREDSIKEHLLEKFKRRI